jgi:hypothetical protein
MISRALKLQERIQAFCRDEKYMTDLSKDTLTNDEWEDLKQTAAGLEPFHIATKRLEGRGGKGHHGSVWEVLPTFEWLLKQLEDAIPKTTSKSKMKWTHHQVSSQNAWEKLTKYYHKTDDCHQIYAAALLFHPHCRIGYFDRIWTGLATQVKQRMLAAVRDTWKRDYESIEHESPDVQPFKRQRRSETPDAIERFIQDAITQHQSITANSDEFERYIHGTPVDGVKNLIEWWAA